MDKLSDLKKGQRFTAEIGKNHIEGVTTMDFNPQVNHRRGYVNVKLDGKNYASRYTSSDTLYEEDGWEIKIVQPTFADKISKLAIGTRFRFDSHDDLTYHTGYIKIGEDAYVNTQDNVKGTRSITVYSASEFAHLRGDRLKIIK